MKNALAKPLLRLAAAAGSSSALGNTTTAQSHPSHPLLSSASTTNKLMNNPFSSSSYSSSLYYPISSTSTTLCCPPSSSNNLQYMKRTFSTKVYPNPLSYGRSFLPLGALALIGGAVLYLANSTAEAGLPFLQSNSPGSRMKARVQKHGFYERQVVPDGNCQMRSIADQLHGNEHRHPEVRSKIMAWLSKNEKFAVDDSGSATIGDFIDRDNFPKWASYIAYMSKNGAWGDHITLLAAAEVYKVNIFIISNVEDNGSGQYLTTINPRSSKSEKTLNLSHWHETHYNSLYPVSTLPQQAA